MLNTMESTQAPRNHCLLTRSQLDTHDASGALSEAPNGSDLSIVETCEAADRWCLVERHIEGFLASIPKLELSYGPRDSCL